MHKTASQYFIFIYNKFIYYKIFYFILFIINIELELVNKLGKL